jgi:ferredoxin-thioredoxin reductase catalytic subunit
VTVEQVENADQPINNYGKSGNPCQQFNTSVTHQNEMKCPCFAGILSAAALREASH